jgi:hypothetical protein
MAEADAAETTTEAQAMTKAERRAVKEARKLSRMGASRLAATTVAASVDGDLITDGERLRREIKAKKKLTASREKDTLAKLAAFQKKFAALGDGGGNKAAAAQQQQGEGTTADEQNRDDGRRAGAAGVTMFASEGLYYAVRTNSWLGSTPGKCGVCVLHLSLLFGGPPTPCSSLMCV